MPVPPALALRSQGAEGEGAKAAGDELKIAAAPAAGAKGVAQSAGVDLSYVIELLKGAMKTKGIPVLGLENLPRISPLVLKDDSAVGDIYITPNPDEEGTFSILHVVDVRSEANPRIVRAKELCVVSGQGEVLQGRRLQQHAFVLDFSEYPCFKIGNSRITTAAPATGVGKAEGEISIAVGPDTMAEVKRLFERCHDPSDTEVGALELTFDPLDTAYYHFVDTSNRAVIFREQINDLTGGEVITDRGVNLVVEGQGYFVPYVNLTKIRVVAAAPQTTREEGAGKQDLQQLEIAAGNQFVEDVDAAKAAAHERIESGDLMLPDAQPQAPRETAETRARDQAAGAEFAADVMAGESGDRGENIVNAPATGVDASEADVTRVIDTLSGMFNNPDQLLAGNTAHLANQALTQEQISDVCVGINVRENLMPYWVLTSRRDVPGSSVLLHGVSAPSGIADIIRDCGYERVSITVDSFLIRDEAQHGDLAFVMTNLAAITDFANRKGSGECVLKLQNSAVAIRRLQDVINGGATIRLISFSNPNFHPNFISSRILVTEEDILAQRQDLLSRRAGSAPAPAAGLQVTLALSPEEIANVTAKVEALRETLPIIMIYKGATNPYYGERPLELYDEGFSFGIPGTSEREQVFYEDLAYCGADARKLAADQKVLIIANSPEEAEAEKAKIAGFGDAGYKPENIKTAASPEGVRAAIDEVGEFDFVIRVGVISYEAELQGLALPKVSMEDDKNMFKLRRRLIDATLASSV
jgi:hypothetical protein